MALLNVDALQLSGTPCNVSLVYPAATATDGRTLGERNVTPRIRQNLNFRNLQLESSECFLINPVQEELRAKTLSALLRLTLVYERHQLMLSRG